MRPKKAVFFLFFAVTGIFILIQSCSLKDTENTKKIVITDQNSGRVLDTYEYDRDTGNLQRVVVFADNQVARKVTEFAYDNQGNLQRSVTQSRGISTVVTDVVDYTVRKEYDSQNRLVKTVQLRDDGSQVETRYGYDEQGRLRGVAQKNPDGSVMMMDYNYE